MLYDPYGREIIREKLTAPITEQMGAVRVRDQFSTYPSVSLTPTKLAGILKEADAGDVSRQCELFEEMEEKDPILGSKLQTRRLAVQALQMEVLPATESAEDKKIAAAVKENLDDIDMDEPLLHLLDAVGKGFASVEINWELSGNSSLATRHSPLAWVHGLSWLPQKRWTFNDWKADWNAPVLKLPHLLTDEEQIHGVEVPAFKVVFHRYLGRSGFTQRAGLLRGLAYYYLFKNYDIKDWIVFLEKYGQPLRIGKFMPGASEDDKKVLKEAIQNLGTDSGALISDQTALEIIDSKGTSSGEHYKMAAEYFDHVYTIGVLGQSATTEGTPGKLGSEKAREQVREDLLRADARALAKTLRQQLAWPMVGFNFGWDKKIPLINFVIEEAEDLNALASTHKTLVDMGAPIPVSYIQKKYGIPEPVGDEPILQPPQPSSVFGLGSGVSPFAALQLKKKPAIPIA